VRADVAAGFWQVLRSTSRDVHDRVASRPRTSRFHTYAGAPGFLRHASGPGWALVGDASIFTDPLSTHGISDAFRDAELLADQVDLGLRDPKAMARALAQYEQQRDRLTLPLLLAADRLASYRWSMHEVRQQLRDVSRAMQDELRVLRAHFGDTDDRAA
jgi:2-polyprenyl-6-methoxyphenol hydroxylase-like FAD-dependent oxidoreductase